MSQKHIISVSKTYKHRGNHRHNPSTKKVWQVISYEYDDWDEVWKMKSKYVNWLQALYYKAQKKHRYKVVCQDCGSVLIAMVKSFKDKVECPNCQEIIEY